MTDDTPPTHCGRPMLRAGNWWHCEVCGAKFYEIREQKDIDEFIFDELREIISDRMLTWKLFGGIMHRLWQDAAYGSDMGFLEKSDLRWGNENE